MFYRPSSSQGVRPISRRHKLYPDRVVALATRHQLKLALVAGDSLAIGLGFTAALLYRGYTHHYGWDHTILVVVLAVVAGLWSVRSQGLFLGRVSAVRVMEICRITRAIGLLAGLVLLIDRVLWLDVQVKVVALASVITFVLFVTSRSIYRAWIASARARGRFCRQVMLVGTDAEARRINDLFATHPELGMRVTGVVGPRTSAIRNELGDLWLGETDIAEEIVEATGVSGVVMTPHGVNPTRLNALARNLQLRGVHVHLSSGIAGIDSRRLRALSIAHEPMFYVEAPTLGRTQLVTKRVFDIVFASVVIVLLSPVIIAVAIAVKVQDGGPILFRQQRVGRDGKLFGVMKFRSMVVDAERELSRLTALNERNGPLFKMTHDPRVTPLGRFLRESSLDELPQLFNVLRGEMSLVGPRPALPSEVTNFSAALRAREQVMPGISGLWQVEARTNPSFEAYSRLDLFYVENWSLTLDLIIILGTVEQCVMRVLGMMRPSRRERAAQVSLPSPNQPLETIVTPILVSSVRQLRDTPGAIELADATPSECVDARSVS